MPSVGRRHVRRRRPGVSNQVYAQAAAGGAEDIERAVAAADEAFRSGPWPGLAARARAKVLNKIADGIEARGERIAAMETFDTGLPVTQAKGQAARAAENFRYFADVIVAQHEEAFSQPGQLGYVLRRPAGVAGLITPWNTPFMLESWKLAPGARLRLHRGAQARRVDAAVRVAAAGDHDRGGRARRGVQHRARHRRGGRRGARRAPGRAADLVHRRDHHRAGHHALGGGPPEGPVDGARREVAVRHLRRRGPGRGDRLRAVRGDVAERRAVHRRLADPGRTFGV